MKTTFSDIIIEILEREGGFVDHESDRGGATKFGVTINTLQRHGIDVDGDGDIDTDDVKAIDLEKAKDLYKAQYWKPSRAAELPPHIRECYFDMVVNHGRRNAVYLLQRAANAAGCGIKTDGIIGPNTLAAAHEVDLISLVHQRVLFYAKIVKRDHSQLDFLSGWINRSFEFLTD